MTPTNTPIRAQAREASLRPNSPALVIPIVLTAMLSFQWGAALAKHVFPYTGPQAMAALRILIAAVLLSAWGRPWRYRLTGRQWRNVLAYGVVLGGMNLSFYLALARIPLGSAVALEFIGPLGLALLASRQKRDLLWVGLAAVGLVLITKATLIPGNMGTFTLDPRGIFFALGAACCWALYIVFGQRAGADVPNRAVTSLGMLTAACVVPPVCASALAHLTLTWDLVPYIFGVAIFSSVLPYSLEMVAMQRLPTRTFGILMSLEPASAAILGFFYLHERLLIPQWFGIGCVVAASAGSATAVGAEEPYVMG
jgi:inner membrane transporter RhtA